MMRRAASSEGARKRTMPKALASGLRVRPGENYACFREVLHVDGVLGHPGGLVGRRSLGQHLRTRGLDAVQVLAKVSGG